MTDFQNKVRKGVDWLLKFKVFKYLFQWIAKDPRNKNKFLILFNIFTTSLVFTAALTPWIYIVWILVIPAILFKSSPLAPLVNLINMARERAIDVAGLIITVFFLMLHYICLFACLYMLFGVIEDNNGHAILGVWDHIYFSVVTFTTLGYGNFVPANTGAEVIASFEAIVGFAVFALLIGIASAVVLQEDAGK